MKEIHPLLSWMSLPRVPWLYFPLLHFLSRTKKTDSWLVHKRYDCKLDMFNISQQEVWLLSLEKVSALKGFLEQHLQLGWKRLLKLLFCSTGSDFNQPPSLNYMELHDHSCSNSFHWSSSEESWRAAIRTLPRELSTYLCILVIC